MVRSNLSAVAAAIFGAGVFILGAIAFVFFSRTETQSAVDLPEPGFVGTTAYGEWELICAPRAEMAPPPLNFDQPESEWEDSEQTDSACRLRHEVLSPPAEAAAAPQVILAIHLSLVGPAQHPALILRLPATLTEGENVILRTRDETVVETMARDCSAEECIAASTLSDDAWEWLVRANALQAVFRIDGVQLVSVDIGTEGLEQGRAALESAQSAKPSVVQSPFGDLPIPDLTLPGASNAQSP